MTLLAALAGHDAVSAAPIQLDPADAAQVYDGHGALSAGASSRLLYDYEEPQRSDILDLLFKPNFGANLHLIKVEIGGDGQSTDGTEPSHMHERDDLSCKRGYEFWLLEEARKRNPAIKTYALSWASPAWVGNQTSFYSQDEIDYHMSWLNCTKDYNIGTIDYIGNWNERSWGPPEWTVEYRAAMDAIGFKETKIIIPDGGDTAGIEKAMSQDATFEAAVDGLGVHYPCNRPVPSIQSTYHKKYWSSEDYSTVGDWSGAACWGRLLNQNFVRMNQTSTIAWSLIWSVYNPGFPYFGNGLMYAFTPWSGYYEAGLPGSSNGAAIWTNAHSGQFTAPGWRYLSVNGGGSGSLPLGGSYVAMISSPTSVDAVPDVTLVVEKLEGRCLRCAGQTTKAETIDFVLKGSLAAHTTLQVWQTNETAHFVNLGNISAQGGTFSFPIEHDSIVTFSSWFNGQTKGSVVIPAEAPFPEVLADSFDSYPIDAEPHYFADNGGSFQIAADPTGSANGNLVLKQWVSTENGVNRWGYNVNPVSLLGNATWSDVSAAVDVLIGPAPSPTPRPGPLYLQSRFSRLCLDTTGRLTVPGSAVAQWTCIEASNEEFLLVGDKLVEQNSKLCLSTTGCSASSPLCIQTCATATNWTVAASQTAGYMTIQTPDKQCLQTSSQTLNSAVTVGDCGGTNNSDWLYSPTTPVSPGAPSYLQNVFSGLCLDTRGAGKVAGVAVDQWTCTSAQNEQYALESGTGHLIGQNSRLCVSDETVCGASTPLCLSDCSKATAWHLTPSSDGMLVQRADGQCLQTASKTLDASVFVGPCNTVTTQMQWLQTTTPPVSPMSDYYVGVCIRADTSGKGTCLTVNSTDAWMLWQGDITMASGKLTQEESEAGGKWTSLNITAKGSVITSSVNGVPLPVQSGTGTGMVAVVSGYHLAYYDNFGLHTV